MQMRLPRIRWLVLAFAAGIGLLWLRSVVRASALGEVTAVKDVSKASVSRAPLAPAQKAGSAGNVGSSAAAAAGGSRDSAPRSEGKDSMIRDTPPPVRVVVHGKQQRRYPTPAEVAARPRGPAIERFAVSAGRERGERFLAHAEMPQHAEYAAGRALDTHPWLTRWGDGIHGATPPPRKDGQCSIVPHSVPIEMLATRRILITPVDEYMGPCEVRPRTDVRLDTATGAVNFSCPSWTSGEWRPVVFNPETGTERYVNEEWYPESRSNETALYQTVIARCKPSLRMHHLNAQLDQMRVFTTHHVDDALAADARQRREAHRAALRGPDVAAPQQKQKQKQPGPGPLGTGSAYRGKTEAEKHAQENIRGKLPPVYDDPPNINLVILDGVSRANFYRTMPKLANYLDGMIGESRGTYESFELRRFHAVECCSYGNQTPLVSGVFIREGEFKFQPKRESPKWMWNLVKQSGFVSSHGIGMCVHPHWAPWERDPSVDRFYVEPFCVKGHEFVYAVAHRPCMLGQDVADMVLDDAEAFFASYPDKSAGKFVFSVLLHGHEPTLGVPRAAEDRLIRHLQRLIEDHPNTVHIVTSDHGIGWSDYAATRTGQLERALPFAFILMPTGGCGGEPFFFFLIFFF
jgi:hypothetical protein